MCPCRLAHRYRRHDLSSILKSALELCLQLSGRPIDMNERELQRRLAKHLKMPVLDDGIWTVLTTRHPEDVKRAQTGDESDLGFVLTLGEHYLFAKEVFIGAPSPPGGTQKLRHVARAVTPEDELRSEAIWAAQVEAAFNDERVSGF